MDMEVTSPHSPTVSKSQEVRKYMHSCEERYVIFTLIINTQSLNSLKNKHMNPPTCEEI